MKVRNRDIILVIGAVFLLASTIFLGYHVFKHEEKKRSDLRVDDVYFVMKGSNSERSRIEIVVFVSNIGEKDVSKLEIRAFTVETGSNLAMDDSSTTITDVLQQTTEEGKLIVDIPNNDSYRMELLIFKENKLEIRGSGTIDLTDVGASYDYRTYPDYVDDDISDGGVAEDTAISWFGGACLLIIIVGVVIAIIIRASVRSGKKPEKIEEGSFLEDRVHYAGQRRKTEPKLEDFEEKKESGKVSLDLK